METLMELEEKYNYKGWNNCLRFSNNDKELIITTDMGPRLIRYGYIGQQNLFREIEEQAGKTGGNEYRLYGGTRFWHAPESIPRTYIPDNEPVQLSQVGEFIKLTQDVEKQTEVQKEVKVKFNPDNGSVNIIYRIYNRTLWDISFAPWILSVMNLGGTSIIAQEPYISWEEKLTPARPIVLWGYTAMDDPRWIWGRKYIQLKQDPKNQARQKIGVLNTQGWAAYHLNGQVFVKRYPYEPDAAYPDFGVNTELYTDPDILEIETLGEFKSISPGGYVEHKENWYLFKADLSTDEKTIDEKLLPLIESTCMP
jgi:hypothetical protein